MRSKVENKHAYTRRRMIALAAGFTAAGCQTTGSSRNGRAAPPSKPACPTMSGNVANFFVKADVYRHSVKYKSYETDDPARPSIFMEVIRDELYIPSDPSNYAGVSWTPSTRVVFHVDFGFQVTAQSLAARGFSEDLDFYVGVDDGDRALIWRENVARDENGRIFAAQMTALSFVAYDDQTTSQDAMMVSRFLEAAKAGRLISMAVLDRSNQQLVTFGRHTLVGLTDALAESDRAWRSIKDEDCDRGTVPHPIQDVYLAMGYAGCFLTTACCDAVGLHDDCWELQTARRFRDGWLARQVAGPEEIAAYYDLAPQIVARVNARPDAERVWKRLYARRIMPTVILARLGLNRAARWLYRRMVKELAAA